MNAALALVLLAQMVEVVPPEVPLPPRVILVVDRSYSMAAVATAALTAVRGMVEQPTDHLDVAAVCFAEEHATHPWIALPDARAAERLRCWIETVDLGWGTVPLPAVRAALKMRPLRQGPVGVVIVTDGVWEDSVERLAIYSLVKHRPPGRVVSVLLVGGGDWPEVAELGRVGGGGTWRLSP